MSTGPALLERPAPSPDADGPPQPPAPPVRSTAQLGVGLLAAVATLLTSTGLSKVFEGFGWWFLPCAGAVLTAVICGLLGRLARVPLLLLPVVYALGMAIYVPAVSAPDTRIGPLPTSASWSALTDLLSVGNEDVRRLAVPVPERPGLVLLVVLGVYAVACAVDVICTRLGSPAAAGLPLLALLAVPAAIVPGDVGLVPFVLGATGYLLLLAIDGHHAVRHRTAGDSAGPVAAGRTTATSAVSPDGSRDVLDTGRSPGTLRIALIGLAAAVLLPALLPGPGKGLIAPNPNNSTSLGSGGSGRARVVQPFVTLDQQLRSEETVPLLRVRTDTPEYLRLTALEIFNGSGFSLNRLQADPQARVSNGLPPPTGNVRTRTASGEVRAQEIYRQKYLPVPYAPTNISVSGDWRLAADTSTVFSGRTDTGGTRYRYTSQVPTPTAADLRAEPRTATVPASVAVDLRFSGVSSRVRALAQQLTRDAPTTYDKVAAIQSYLRGPLFVYDLNGAPRDGRNALDQFLFDTRRGYCEQFASSMAVLVRAIGVPARVAIGFTPGSRDTNGDWVITNRDAHAWPEVWFPNAGWVRFEPTPRDDSAEVTPDYSIPPPPGSDSTTGPSTSSAAERDTGPNRSSANAAQSNPSTSVPADQPTVAMSAGGVGWGWDLGGAAAVLGVALLAGPALIRLLRRRRRLSGTDPAAAWRELSDTATDLGLGVGPTESPRAAGRRWGDTVGDVDPDGRARTALDGLAQQAEWARFARADGAGAGVRSQACADARTAVGALERASRRRDRIRAWLWPRSLTEWSGRWFATRRAGLRRALRLRRPRRVGSTS